MVELKSGETLNGHLINCDTWMNLTLRDVIQTSADGQKFLKLPMVYVRGNIIKYLRVPEQLLDHIKEERQTRNEIKHKEKMQERERERDRDRRRGAPGGQGGRKAWSGQHANRNQAQNQSHQSSRSHQHPRNNNNNRQGGQQQPQHQ